MLVSKRCGCVQFSQDTITQPPSRKPKNSAYQRPGGFPDGLLNSLRMPFGKTVASCLVVLPAHDEAASLPAVLNALRGVAHADFLVVSDASTDATAAVAKAGGAQVLEMSQQIGAWGATQAGFRYALRNGYARVASMDADGQHDVPSLAALLQTQAETGADVVIGTFPERLSPLRRLAWSWFRVLTGLRVEDLTSGLRVYGPRALPVVASPEATLIDYQDVGVLLLLRRYGLTVHEVPVTMYPRQAGKSRVFASWLTVARYMAQTTVICLARLGTRRVRPMQAARS